MLADAGRIAAVSVSGPIRRGLSADDARVGEFCRVALASLLDGHVGVPDGCFVQGFCAALDALVSCTIDFDRPAETVRQAWRDVLNDGSVPPRVTSVMDFMAPTGGSK